MWAEKKICALKKKVKLEKIFCTEKKYLHHKKIDAQKVGYKVSN